jgi:hypothetical protein
LTARITTFTIYTIYNESLELNPEKPKGGETGLHYNIPTKQLTGAKSRNRKNQKKEVKKE